MHKTHIFLIYDTLSLITGIIFTYLEHGHCLNHRICTFEASVIEVVRYMAEFKTFMMFSIILQFTAILSLVFISCFSSGSSYGSVT